MRLRRINTGKSSLNFFITTLSTNPTLFLLVVLSVIPSICLHEYFHAQTALWMGDDTAARQGHLTLNPLRQMGWLSLVMFLLIGIAWGMVPVDRSKLTRKGAILTTFAGPLTNLVLFFLSAAALCLMILLDRNGIVFPELLGLYFQILGLYNLVLFILNMLPIPVWTDGQSFRKFFRSDILIPNLSTVRCCC